MLCKLRMWHVTTETLDDIKKTLEKDSSILFQWFLDNQFRANIGKCYLIDSGKNMVAMRVGDIEISPLSATPQNDQTHSNNSSAVAVGVWPFIMVGT